MTYKCAIAHAVQLTLLRALLHPGVYLLCLEATTTGPVRRGDPLHPSGVVGQDGSGDSDRRGGSRKGHA